MYKLLIGLLSVGLLSACSSVEKENANANEPKVRYEKEYVLGRLAPVKKEQRSTDVKQVDKEDMGDMMKKVLTPLDP